MGIALGVPYEAFSRSVLISGTHPYCKTNPQVYVALGFATGVPLVRLEIELNAPRADELIKNFVALCTGSTRYKANKKALSFLGSSVDVIDSLHGIVLLGQTLPAVGHSNGFAATEKGVVKSAPDTIPTYALAGSIVMLPRDTDAGTFSSVFYVTTQAMTIYDGKVIGKVTAGMEDLRYMVRHFGSENGAPKKAMFVHECGQI